MCHQMLPLDDPLFDIIFVLMEVSDMLKAPFFYKSWFYKLSKLIEKLLSFVRVDLNIKIYPKLQHMIHYPS